MIGCSGPQHGAEAGGGIRAAVPPRLLPDQDFAVGAEGYDRGDHVAAVFVRNDHRSSVLHHLKACSRRHRLRGPLEMAGMQPHSYFFVARR